MNIRNFLSYRETCLYCNHNLNFYIQSKSSNSLSFLKNQYIRIEISTGDFPSSKNNPKISFYLFLNLDDNSYYVIFLDKKAIELAKATETHIKACDSYLKNKTLTLYKKCLMCNSHSITSNRLEFDLDQKKIKNVGVAYESLDDGNWIITNNYISNTSSISKVLGPATTEGLIESPLIQITSLEEVMERLKVIVALS